MTVSRSLLRRREGKMKPGGSSRLIHDFCTGFLCFTCGLMDDYMYTVLRKQQQLVGSARTAPRVKSGFLSNTAAKTAVGSACLSAHRDESMAQRRPARERQVFRGNMKCKVSRMERKAQKARMDAFGAVSSAMTSGTSGTVQASGTGRRSYTVQPHTDRGGNIFMYNQLVS